MNRLVLLPTLYTTIVSSSRDKNGDRRGPTSKNTSKIEVQEAKYAVVVRLKMQHEFFGVTVLPPRLC